MLVELGLVELRYQAVLEVVNQGATVTDVAARFGVTRQTVHRWLRRYAAKGLAGLADGSERPVSCPHQMPAVVEARIVELRRLHPGWGPRTILFRLEAERVVPLPGRSSVYRCLVRHGLIEPVARRRKKADYKRWERSRSMELWQMDVVGGVRLVNGWKASIVSGVDDHSRFVISAYVVERATARPVCEALTKAMRTFGVPREVLTDNGKVFTGRFGPGTGEVLFDRICRENGIRHILTAPRSPTTTGKVEHDDIGVATGLQRRDVERGLHALLDAGYVHGVDAAAEELCFLIEIGLRERGRRATGQWPAEDSERAFLELVSARLEAAEDDEERSRWKKLLDAAKGLSGKAFSELTVAFLKHQTGLA